jgi:hypothetical protein
LESTGRCATFCGPHPLSLAADELERYAAEWGDARETTWKTKVEYGRLVLEVPGSSLPPPELVAESETHFSSRGGW